MKTKPLIHFVSILFLFSLFFLPQLHAQHTKFKVVLDAGHGGKDPGNRGNGYYEKEIALNIVLLVGKELDKNNEIEVIYTRKTDVFLELHERAAIANKADADLFVSIHCNAHHSNAHGTETFILGLDKNAQNLEIAKKENQVIYLEDNYKESYGGFDPNAPESLIGLIIMQEEYLEQSISIASLVQDNFTHQLKRNNRSVKQGPFWVLHNTYMPSVLIETGFLTNKNEGAYLNSKKGQQEMASAVAQAIIDYYDSVKYSYISSTTESQLNSTTPNTVPEVDIYENVLFKVQIAAGSRKLDTKPKNFKGLTMISREQEGGLYKYYYGNTSDYNLIQALHKEAKVKGYISAFIVAYKNGKRVQLTDIIN
ncbi:MAG: N-acetylmuramoyl-L-alanine amidase [Flavobacteriaceae bacterium]